jgi:Holliday junction resolvase RusA-like endonuclease
MILTFFEHTIPLAPHAKQRPRLGKGRTYTPEATERFERQCAWILRAYIGPRDPMLGPISVRVAFFLEAPKKSKHGYPSSADIDNYLKSLFDACNGVVWKDDRQIVELTARKVFGPKAEIWIQAKPCEVPE